ncbi:MAG TPA: hypothetical protein VK599_11425 [Streptosporangiaceae bacterium]|nr:hypothetical protein [Streptosporangiaceae bacterium]
MNSPTRMGYTAAVALAVLSLSGCGSSTATTGTTTPTASPAPATSSAEVDAALPDPCTLLTVAEVEPLFGTTALDMTKATGPAPGVVACAFTLKVGVQGKVVTVRVHNDYGNDPSYVFPNQNITAVPGLGHPAVLQSDNDSSVLTVQLGSNTLEMGVDFYTDPINNTFVSQLATDALGRIS